MDSLFLLFLDTFCCISALSVIFCNSQYPIIKSPQAKVVSWWRDEKRKTISGHSLVVTHSGTCIQAEGRTTQKIQFFLLQKLGLLVVTWVPEDWAGSSGQMRVVGKVACEAESEIALPSLYICVLCCQFTQLNEIKTGEGKIEASDWHTVLFK